MKKLTLLTIIMCILSGLAFAQANNNTSEVLPNLDNNPTNTSVLNDQIRQMQSRVLAIENGVDINNGTNGILGVKRGGTGQDASTWTAGDVVYMSSTGVYGHETLTIHGIQVVTVSGTFTAPVGIYGVWLTLQGAGASGGSNTVSGSSGAGGGSGAFLTGAYYPVIPGNAYTVTIGQGGVAINSGGNTNGNAGGATSFGNLSAAGGGATSASGATAGSGGAINAASNLNGSGVTPGAIGYSFGSQIAGGNGGANGGTGVSGAGAGTIFGPGGAANTTPSLTSYGASGGGTSGSTSGAGINGIAIIQY